MSVPKLRFKEFDGDWSLTTLNQLSTKIGDGIHATPKYDESGTIPFINGNNLVNGRVIINENTKRISNEEFQKYNQVLSDRTLFLSINGTIGNLAFYKNEKVLLGKSVCFINLKNDLDKKFIYLLLQSPQLTKTLNSELTGTTIKNLSLATVRNSEFYCPIEAEQTKIASFLSVVDEKISQLTQKHELLSQYKQGMMQKLFSQQIRFKADDGSEFGEWEDLKICDLVRSLDAGVSVNSEDIKPTNDEYSVLKTSCISSGYFDENERKRVLLEEEINRLKEPVLDNSILMSRMNTPLLVGMNAYIEKAPKNTYLPDRLWQLKINADKVLTRWLAFYLGSENGLSQIRDLASGTSNSMKNIKKSDVLNLEIFVPSKEEQTKIANFLSAVDQKIEVMAQQIEQAKTWKKGLLQQMFV
ncbi:restriction endonuclease subunit S [Acinetobacter faecalis]|nr:restriction endonuclease subunit S [Acinetobacter faecalis]MDY6459349.1 restriction endonuclease subunit S [Acinetobacter faecalis]